MKQNVEQNYKYANIFGIRQYVTVCPGSSYPFYIVSYFIKWVTTSWTYGIYIHNIQDGVRLLIKHNFHSANIDELFQNPNFLERFIAQMSIIILTLIC